MREKKAILFFHHHPIVVRVQLTRWCVFFDRVQYSRDNNNNNNKNNSNRKSDFHRNGHSTRSWDLDSLNAETFPSHQRHQIKVNKADRIQHWITIIWEKKWISFGHYNFFAKHTLTHTWDEHALLCYGAIYNCE